MENTKKKPTLTKQAKKYILNVLLLLIVTVVAVYFVLKDDPSQIIDYIAKSDIKYILISILAIFAFYLVEALILMILARMYNPKYKYIKGFWNCMIGVFFSGITPSNSGGQFVQAFTFSKQGVKVTNAASILLMHFIVYQIVSVLFSALIFIFKFEELRSYTQVIDIFGFKFDIIFLSIIGFVVNVLVITVLFFASFSKGLHKFITTTGVSIMAKLRLVKDKEQKAIELNTKFETFRIELSRLLQNTGVLISTSLLFVVKIILFNIIPYFVALSLGVEFRDTNAINNIFNCVSMSLFSTTITQMIPLPGASGGSELVFKMLFDNFFLADGSQISAIILIWRAITYYLGLILGFIIFIAYRESPKAESIHGNEKTLLQLRIVSLDNEKKTLKLLEEDDYNEEETLTPKEIEERFKKLKKELSKQLKTNQKSLDEESKEEE